MSKNYLNKKYLNSTDIEMGRESHVLEIKPE
jgi:hypothetical protein